jgi:O-antigen/teichoic acid export membrane protein
MHRELLSFSLPLMISGAMARVLRDLDTYLLSYFSETASVGVYNIVYPIAMLPMFVLTSFGYLFMPVISELHSEGRNADMSSLYSLVTKWVFFGTLPILLPIAMFPETTIRLTFGPEYVSGAVALSVLTAGYAFSALLGPNSSLLTSIGRSRLVMYDNAFAVVLNFVVNLVLIPRYGIVGAAGATVASYFAMNVLFSYQVYTETGAYPVSTAIVKPALSAFALMGGVYLLVNFVVDPGILGIVLIYASFLSLYGVSLLVLGAVEREEVMLVLQFEDRFSVDLGPLKRLAAKLMDDVPTE